MIPQPDEEYFANDHTAETMITLRTISQPMRLVTAVGAAGAGVQGGGVGDAQEESIGQWRRGGEAERSTAVVQRSTGSAGQSKGAE